MEFDTTTPPYSTADPTSFAWTSCRDRWPVILTSAIDDLHRTLVDLDNDKASADDAQTKAAKLAEGKAIVAGIVALKYDVQHNRPLTPLDDDGEADIASYNAELAERNAAAGASTPLTWCNAPWLFTECYLYRRMHVLFARSAHWRAYDVFRRQKLATFRSSRPAVLELAAKYRELVAQIEAGAQEPAEAGEAGEAAQRTLFAEVFETCLWGNATDLSLLTSLTYADLQKLQGARARKAAEKNILVNDLPAAFDVLRRARDESGGASAKSRRVDLVLDNAGFELYVDLILAGYLLASGLATTVVLHPKSLPWFVSDVLPALLVMVTAGT
ncbi:hypothetical protein KEM52_002068 [Ascosphaera acerosa]|nr:hypothetical protein KEM52_002068 [Ascosphaera acerosa]